MGMGVRKDPKPRSADNRRVKDHYQTLGVPRDAAADEIKKAYRKLARKHHPDVSKATDAHVRMAAVNEAHEALSKPASRAAYDEELLRPARPAGTRFHAGARGSSGPGFAFYPPGDDDAAGNGDGGGDGSRSDFFEQIFGRSRAGRRGPPVAARGADQTASIELDLLDAYQGAERSFTFTSSAAGGDGSAGSQPQVNSRTLQVRIPRGIRAGQQIRLAGSGSPGAHGGPAGDLLLAVSFKPDTRWRADGRNVYQHLPIAPWEAVLGTTATVATPGGQAEVHIPAGWQPGRKLRLKGRGIPGAGQQEAGHLYLELALALPSADSEAQRAAYTAFAAAFPEFAPHTPNMG